MKVKNLTLWAVIGLTTFLTASCILIANKTTVEVVNKTTYNITEVDFINTKDASQNSLNSVTIFPGNNIQFLNIADGTWQINVYIATTPTQTMKTYPEVLNASGSLGSFVWIYVTLP